MIQFWVVGVRNVRQYSEYEYYEVRSITALFNSVFLLLELVYQHIQFVLVQNLF